MAWDTHPQSAGGWLYILKPAVVMKCRVNMASATYPAHEITYDGVTLGAYTDIDIGQTILVGSYDGGHDLGWTYLRATPSGSVLPIGWSSRGRHAGEVTLTDDAYITVLDTYEVWNKIPRWSGTVMYRDYDLEGSTPPSPIMHVGDLGGLGHIGFAEAGVLVLDALDWSGSTLVNSGESWAGQNWYFVDGTPTSGDENTADPDVSFPVGARWLRLYGESSAGAVTYRRYLVVSLDPADPDTVRFNNLKIRRTAEGQTLTADLHEPLDPDEYPPGSIVMYLAKERRGTTTTIVQRFAGWLETESSSAQARVTHTQRGTSITAVDVAGKLAKLNGTASMIDNEASQGNYWVYMVEANPERYIHRLLAFETTALSLADWTLTGLTGTAAYPFMSWSVSGGTMYQVCDGLAKAMAHRLTCDSQGRLWILPDPMRQDSGDRTSTVQRHIDESAWSRLDWAAAARARVGVLKSQNAVVSSGYASALVTPFPDVYSIAPGESAGQGARESQMERGIVQNQTESDARVGHDYARMTAPQGLYTIDMAHGVDADIEPAHLTWVTVTASANYAGYRGPALTTARGLPVSVDLAVSAETGVSVQRLTWERETVGDPGVERTDI